VTIKNLKNKFNSFLKMSGRKYEYKHKGQKPNE